MSEDATSRMRTAASLLTKGGTLTNEPCAKCGGVQVRFGNKTTCINCGNEVKTGDQPRTIEEKFEPVQVSTGLISAASIITKKIVMLAAELEDERDISVQKQKAELLEIYLRILDKARSLNS
jgi:uncharacterized Zn finger protein (UPF0148 family)